MTSSTANRDVVLFSTADWATRYWTNKQHNTVALMAKGHRVLYVETVGIRTGGLGNKRDLGRIARRLAAGLDGLIRGPREVKHNIWRLSPLVVPWARRWRWLEAINAGLLRWTLRRFLTSRQFERPDIWTYHPFMLQAIDGLARRRLIYHCVDDLAAIPGVDAVQYKRSEIELLRAADIVLVTARPLEARAKEYNEQVYFLPNVADPEHFGRAFGAKEAADLTAIAHPRLGYHGVLTANKLDVDLLAAVLRARPNWQLVLIGDEQPGQASESFSALRALPNAHFMGSRSYDVLPSYLAGFDVGLVPLVANDYTASVFPMKFYEFLAAGVPVASTDLPYLSEASGPVRSGKDLPSFIAAIEAQLARGRLTREEARLAVGENTWEKRLDKMLALIEAIGR